MQKRNTVQVAEGGRRSRAATEAVAFDTLRVRDEICPKRLGADGRSKQFCAVGLNGNCSADAGAPSRWPNHQMG
jgi:hypothetical protein